jgi:alkanesulfonate monooxygenase SsuD/methylene tetrahydromethanopterin reductase-like flavin-dependent oxidoreductase (luciferase family)
VTNASVGGGHTPEWLKALETYETSDHLIARWIRQVHDERLWYAVARLTRAVYDATTPVGTPSQVGDALLAYYDVAVTTFVIRGFDSYDDAVDYGSRAHPRTGRLS